MTWKIIRTYYEVLDKISQLNLYTNYFWHFPSILKVPLCIVVALFLSEVYVPVTKDLIL